MRILFDVISVVPVLIGFHGLVNGTADERIKEVQSFWYYEKIVPVLKAILDQTADKSKKI